MNAHLRKKFTTNLSMRCFPRICVWARSGFAVIRFYSVMSMNSLLLCHESQHSMSTNSNYATKRQNLRLCCSWHGKDLSESVHPMSMNSLLCTNESQHSMSVNSDYAMKAEPAALRLDTAKFSLNLYTRCQWTVYSYAMNRNTQCERTLMPWRQNLRLCILTRQSSLWICTPNVNEQFTIMPWIATFNVNELLTMPWM
jgi:hypothetical protein